MTKKNRQAHIKEIILAGKVTSQEDLLGKLRETGFDTTQATLSRDLHEIGIVRVPDGEGFKYVFHEEDNSRAIKQIIGMEIIKVTHNESTVVVRTLAGRAQGVGIYLDKLKDNHILGTVAGDDAIIIIPDTHNNVEQIVSMIRELMT